MRGARTTAARPLADEEPGRRDRLEPAPGRVPPRACAGVGQGVLYRFRFTRSCRTSSELEMTRLLAWKPRWATISPVNSSARSTLDISSAPAMRVPRPPAPGLPIAGCPELSPTRKELLPAFARPRSEE